MRLKPGVNFNISQKMLEILPIVNSIYAEYNTEVVITSCMGGHHMKGSKHYHNPSDAIDIRTRNLDNQKEKEIVAREIQEAIGNDYFVLLEVDHIHIQFNKQD